MGSEALRVRLRIEVENDDFDASKVRTEDLLVALGNQYVSPFENHYQDAHKGPLLSHERALIKAFLLWVAHNQGHIMEDSDDNG